MKRRRADRAVTRVIGGLSVLAVTACGGGGGVPIGPASGATGGSGGEPPISADPPAYGDLLRAIEGANVALCPTDDPEGFVPLPAPSAAAARDYSYFRYLDGAIYEFGPCQLSAGRRNELRLYRYPDPSTRDTALVDLSRRQTRPTSTFAFREVLAVEIWSPEPALDSPVGQAAATVHSAISEVPDARHLDAADGR